MNKDIEQITIESYQSSYQIERSVELDNDLENKYNENELLASISAATIMSIDAMRNSLLIKGMIICCTHHDVAMDISIN